MSEKREWRRAMESLLGMEPRDVVGQWSIANFLQNEQLMLQILGNFQFDNFPEEWDMEYFKLVLFSEGMICITDTDVGVVPLRCGATGINIWERPTRCIIANAILGSFERTIGEDCALIHCKPNYRGFLDWIRPASYLLASCDSAIAVNLMNSKTPFIGEVETPAQKKELEKMHDEITAGNPLVIARQGTGSNFTLFNTKNSFISDMIMDLKQDIKNDWLCTIGIKSVDEKKERLISSEVEAGNEEVEYNIQHIRETIQRDLNVANKLYGLNIQVRALSEERRKENGNTP